VGCKRVAKMLQTALGVWSCHLLQPSDRVAGRPDAVRPSRKACWSCAARDKVLAAVGSTCCQSLAGESECDGGGAQARHVAGHADMRSRGTQADSWRGIPRRLSDTRQSCRTVACEPALRNVCVGTCGGQSRGANMFIVCRRRSSALQAPVEQGRPPPQLSPPATYGRPCCGGERGGWAPCWGRGARLQAPGRCPERHRAAGQQRLRCVAARRGLMSQTFDSCCRRQLACVDSGDIERCSSKATTPCA
jgi:hypothetical protein